MNATYEAGFARGARAMRNGAYDDTVADFVSRVDAAADYLVRHNVLHFSYDRDFYGVRLSKTKQAETSGRRG